MRYFLLIVVVFFEFIFIACDDLNEGETVETANILYPEKEYVYKFYRNGSSSVDYYDVQLLDEPLNLIQRRLDQGIINQNWAYKEAVEMYNKGVSHINPSTLVKLSVYKLQKQTQVNNDILSFLQQASHLSNKKATEGVSGFAGIAANDKNRVFVNEKGLALSEVFYKAIQGAIYLDKILNYHLSDHFISDLVLQNRHENTLLVQGRNYTELEHHLDMAYGYFVHIQKLTQSDGIVYLKGIERQLLDAFYLARYNLGLYNYDVVVNHIGQIRELLSKVFAARALELLLGNITVLNYEESSVQGFKFISRAYGAIYALQFTCNAQAKLYYNYQEVNSLINKMMQNRGLWNRSKILGDYNTEGSLKNIAQQIGATYNIALDDILR